MHKRLTLFLVFAASLCLFAQPRSVQDHAVSKDRVTIVARHHDGTIFYRATVHNLETNAGLDFQAAVMGGTSAQPAACNYLALTNTAITPGATDTTLSGEITTNGLSRAQATYAHTAAAASYSEAHTWTATGAQSAQAAGMFNASSAGTMCFENTFTGVSLATNDTLTLTWTVNY
jgi:hypothetical protein